MRTIVGARRGGCGGPGVKGGGVPGVRQTATQRQCEHNEEAGPLSCTLPKPPALTKARGESARSGAGQRASGTRARSGTGPGGDVPRRHSSPGALVERHGTSTWLARPRGPRRRPSSPQPSWGSVQRPPRPSHALTVGRGLGADVASARPSGSRSPKRWSRSPWPSSRRFGSLGTRMSSYHYVLETLLSWVYSHCGR